MRSPKSLQSMIAFALVLAASQFSNAEAHPLVGECHVFSKKDAEKLRENPVRPTTSSTNCYTDTEFQFDVEPVDEYFEVSFTGHDPNDIQIHIWKDFVLPPDSAQIVFESIDEIVSLLVVEIEEIRDIGIKTDSRSQIERLIERVKKIDSNEYESIKIKYDVEKRIREIEEIFLASNSFGGDVPLALYGAAEAIQILVIANKCYTAALTNSIKAKNGFCIGEASVAEFAGCQISFNRKKPANRRGIVWLDEIPGSTQNMKPAMVKCWLAQDFRELRNYFTPKQRRHLCKRRSPSKVPGRTCPK